MSSGQWACLSLPLRTTYKMAQKIAAKTLENGYFEKLFSLNQV